MSVKCFILQPTLLTSRQVVPFFMNSLYHLLTDSLTTGSTERNVPWSVGVGDFPAVLLSEGRKCYRFSLGSDSLSYTSQRQMKFLLTHHNNNKAGTGVAGFIKLIHGVDLLHEFCMSSSFRDALHS